MKVGVTSEDIQTSEATVTPTEADRFYSFKAALPQSFGGHFKRVDPANEASSWDQFVARMEGFREGDFVNIADARLLVPPYALPLPKLSYAARELPPGAPTVSRPRLTALIAKHPQEVNDYLRPLGTNPRIPVVAYARVTAPDGKVKTFTFFLPLSYANLVNAPALISGSVNVLGKIVRIVKPSQTRSRVEDCRDSDDSYDVEAATAFTGALKHASHAIRRTRRLER